LLDAKIYSYATTDEGVLSRPYSPRNFSPASFVRVNGKIRAREVRVIGVDGNQLGVISLNDAINLARQNGVDLVEIAATGHAAGLPARGFRQIPLRTGQEGKGFQEASARLDGEGSAIKPRIDPHDLGIKVTHAVDFFVRGHESEGRASKFRGREMAHTEVGFQVVNKFLAEIVPYGNPRFSRRNSSAAASM